MKAQPLRELTAEELEARIRQLRDEVFNLRVKHATGQLQGTATLQRSRRDLARALTVRHERSRAQ